MRHKLWNQRSVFVPGSRMRMNIVPMFLNIFLPWGAFVLCCGVSSFSTMYNHPRLAWFFIVLVCLICVVGIFFAIYARKYDPDPTWLSYTAVALTIMTVWGTVVGQNNFETWSRPYHELQDLKVVHGIDASFTPGKNIMDGGLFFFNRGNHIDSQRSWHFKFKNLYCVAPIITNSSPPLVQEYSYWAVGRNCCSMSSSDFRCGSWGNLGASGGIRVTSSGDLAYYRLAVQQAESLYNIMAPSPIFLTWSSSPADEIQSWNAQVFKSYLIMVCFALAVSVFAVTVMTCSYAWIGRGPSAYAMDDPGRNTQNICRDLKDYGAKLCAPP